MGVQPSMSESERDPCEGERCLRERGGSSAVNSQLRFDLKAGRRHEASSSCLLCSQATSAHASRVHAEALMPGPVSVACTAVPLPAASGWCAAVGPPDQPARLPSRRQALLCYRRASAPASSLRSSIPALAGDICGTWLCGSLLGPCVQANGYCPLCIEALDETEQNFFPCPCGCGFAAAALSAALQPAPACLCRQIGGSIQAPG